jgi:hypothetical protein
MRMGRKLRYNLAFRKTKTVNPVSKPEGRNPKEIRSPKAEESVVSYSGFGLLSGFGLRI